MEGGGMMGPQNVFVLSESFISLVETVLAQHGKNL